MSDCCLPGYDFLGCPEHRGGFPFSAPFPRRASRLAGRVVPRLRDRQADLSDPIERAAFSAKKLRFCASLVTRHLSLLYCFLGGPQTPEKL